MAHLLSLRRAYGYRYGNRESQTNRPPCGHRRGRGRCDCRCCWSSIRSIISPRTDDASVWANYIEIAPEVTGRLVELPIKDNAFVKKGDLLFVIDPRPYEYALQQALSDQRALEEQIIDERRRIAAQNSAVEAAGAAVSTSKTGIQTAGSNIDAARAAVTHAQAAATAAEAQLRYATNDYHRIEPLLQKQYVTVEQVDQANTAVRVAQGNYDEAQAALRAGAGTACVTPRFTMTRRARRRPSRRRSLGRRSTRSIEWRRRSRSGPRWQRRSTARGSISSARASSLPLTPTSPA